LFHWKVFGLQDNPEDMSTIDSCEYIWEAGVGFTHSPATAASYDRNRCELLKLLLACFSETMYMPPIGQWQILLLALLLLLLLLLQSATKEDGAWSIKLANFCWH